MVRELTNIENVVNLNTNTLFYNVIKVYYMDPRDSTYWLKKILISSNACVLICLHVHVNIPKGYH